MAFSKRREFLFVYSVKDANPNGDPLNANHPRYDAETNQVLVSDVRIKRTIRDQWLRDGHPVFVDGESKTLKTRVEELKKQLNVKTAKEALMNCIDTRLFGVTFASEKEQSSNKKESFAWTGPIQFKWGRSLHQAKAELIQGTAAFATKEESEQRSFRNEYIVPFVLLGVYGIANQYPSETTGATEDDVSKIAEGLWQGTINLITRSKVGHVPRILLQVIYQEGFEGIAGALDEKLRVVSPHRKELTTDEQLAIRSPKDFLLDMSGIGKRLLELESEIEKVLLWTDDEIVFEGLNEMEHVFGNKFQLKKR